MKSKIKAIAQKINRLNLNTFLWLAIGAVFLINIAVILQNKSMVAQKKAEADELARPANIEILIIKESSCADCADIANYIDAIKKQSVKVVAERTIDANSEEGKNIIKEYEIARLPGFIIKGELEKNDGLKNLLNNFGKIKDGVFAFTGNFAPYFDVSSGKTKGAVGLTLVSDKSCAECSDAKIYKQILVRFGMIKFTSETELDRSDLKAKNLIQKYKIAALPTFVLSGEVSEYPNLANTWAQVGTIEKDGAYAFKEVKVTGLVYSDLKTGKVVNPQAQNQ